MRGLDYAHAYIPSKSVPLPVVTQAVHASKIVPALIALDQNKGIVCTKYPENTKVGLSILGICNHGSAALETLHQVMFSF